MYRKLYVSVCVTWAIAMAQVTLFSSCEKEVLEDSSTECPSHSVLPRLMSMDFCAGDNPMQIVEDTRCEITGDSIVECWIRNLVSDKHLIARFCIEGSKVTIDGNSAVSGQTVCDYGKPVRLTVMSQGKSKTYKVYVHSFTGLPVVWVETDGRVGVTSKEEYRHADFRLVEDTGEGVKEETVSIRGRGNTTWDMPKKSYSLKFPENVSLLGEHSGKSWVLLANYADKTMLRQKTAFAMGQMSLLDYTPRSRFVELMLNGSYDGTYLLCEKVTTGCHRVAVGDDGFLLEIDARAGDGNVTIMTPHLEQPICIKKPEGIAMGDADYNYIHDYMLRTEEALFSDEFTDKTRGWQAYMDMDSFADWYLINEIARNTDACLYTSCFMHLARGGKLKMGPLWDFDIAFGNADYADAFQVEGFRIREATWFDRLFQDPAFVRRARERFDYFYSHKTDIFNEINQYAHYLRYAVEENDSRWHTLYTYTWPNYNVWGSYKNEVQYMKEWLNARFEWLKHEL